MTHNPSNGSLVNDPSLARAKACKRCGEMLEPVSFHREAKAPDGRRSSCIQCRSEETRHVEPPGIPGPCPDCAMPVLLWTATADQSRIALLEQEHAVSWVVDTAIGPTLRSTWPVHRCKQTAPLSAYQRGVIEWVWAHGEVKFRQVMKGCRPRAGVTYLEAKASIEALCPGWLSIAKTARGSMLLRYVGPDAPRYVEVAWGQGNPEDHREYQSQNNKQETE